MAVDAAVAAAAFAAAARRGLDAQLLQAGAEIEPRVRRPPASAQFR